MFTDNYSGVHVSMVMKMAERKDDYEENRSLHAGLSKKDIHYSDEEYI